MTRRATFIKRISRPCYNKWWRCPGWAGGGMRYAAAPVCENGGAYGYIEAGESPNRMWVCHECGTLVLPLWVRYFDPAHWRSELTYYLYWKLWLPIKDSRKRVKER